MWYVIAEASHCEFNKDHKDALHEVIYWYKQLNVRSRITRCKIKTDVKEGKKFQNVKKSYHFLDT